MKKVFFLCFVFSVFLSDLQAQHRKKKTNQYVNGIPHGLWMMYIDSNQTRLECKGHYTLGRETGTWKYFHENGKMRKKEVFRKSGIRSEFYYENGKRKSKGIAILEPDQNNLHYYFQGKWKYYNEQGKLSSIVYYEHGEEVRTEIVR